MYTEKGSFGISISHLWTDYWIDFVAWPMISFCSDEPGVTAHICIRSYKTGRSLLHIYIYLMNVSNIVIFHMLVVDVLGYRVPLVFFSVLCWGFQHSSPNLRSGPAKKRSPALVQSCLPHSLAAQHLLAFQPKGRVVHSSMGFSAEDDPIGSKEYNKNHPMKLMKTKGWCISEEGCLSYPKDQKGFWRKMHRIEKNRKKKRNNPPCTHPRTSMQLPTWLWPEIAIQFFNQKKTTFQMQKGS